MSHSVSPQPSQGLYQRGKIWYFDGYPNGRRKRISLQTSDYAEAVRRRKLELEKIPTARHEGLLRTAQLYTEDMLEQGKLKPNSANELMRLVTDMSRFCDVARLDDINEKVLQRYFDMLMKPGPRQVKPASWHSYAARLSGFFSGMVEKKRMTFNPMDRVKLPKFSQAAHARTNTVDAATAGRLIEECPDDEIKLVLLLGFTCGMRKNEIIQARWSWFDLNARVCRIPLTERKVQKAASPPINSQLMKHLERMKKALPRPPKPSDYLMKPEVEKGLWRYRYDFDKPFEKYLAQQKVQFTAHDMRRSFATNCVQQGISLEIISTWTGDTVRTLEIHYKHLAAYDPRVEKILG